MRDLILLTTPRTSTQGRLYRRRVQVFFQNARANLAAAFIGGLVVAAVLLEHQSGSGPVGVWLVLFLAANLWLYRTTRAYRAELPLRLLPGLLRRRMAAGLLVAALYGASPFLLPDGVGEAAVTLIALVLLLMLFITVFTYHVIPVYYLLVDLVGMGPLLVYLAFFNEAAGPLVLAVVLIAQLVVLPKGLQISRVGLERLRLDLRLDLEIERHRKARRAIEHLALHDPLTGVANRRLFKEFWERSAKLARRKQKRLGLILVDLDEFKPVNDRLGHEAGDHMLKTVAQRLVSGVREGDLVTRYGGDEFCILLEDVTSHEALCALADKLARRVAEPVAWEEATARVGASTGCALFPEDGTTMAQMLRIADRRMYEIKRGRKQSAAHGAPEATTRG